MVIALDQGDLGIENRVQIDHRVQDFDDVEFIVPTRKNAFRKQKAHGFIQNYIKGCAASVTIDLERTFQGRFEQKKFRTVRAQRPFNPHGTVRKRERLRILCDTVKRDPHFLPLYEISLWAKKKAISFCAFSRESLP